MQSLSSKRGVSLIEVMISMALFTTAVIVLTQGYVDSMNALESVKTDDPRLADIRFIQDVLYDIDKQEDFQSYGELPTPGSGAVRFQAQLEETDLADVFEAKLRLDFIDLRNDPKYANWEETRYLYRPDWVETQKRESVVEAKRDALDTLLASRKPKP